MRALWPDRQTCSHNVSQKVKRIGCFSEFQSKELLSAESTQLAAGSRALRNRIRPFVEVLTEGIQV